MIDDPAPDPRPRHVQHPVPRARPGHPPDDEPGWGDPFASHGTLSDPTLVPVDVRAEIEATDPWRADLWSDDPVEGTGPSVPSVQHGTPGAHAALRTPAPHGAWMVSPPGPATGGAGRRPLLLAMLRPWLDPRPGELRGMIALLAGSLAVSLALWFDASRRPSLDAPGTSAASAVSGRSGLGGDIAPVGPGTGPGSGPDIGVAPGSVDGSDGWGLGAASSVPRGPVVHVSGAVREPGIVTLPEGSRVADAVTASGGAMPDARLDRLNLARRVDDGERIHVPRVGEDAPPPDEPASRGILADGRIDINAASQAELETLPGVGPARAQAIIAEREARPFRAPGDLRRVPGIGETTFQRLASLVAVR